MARAPNPGAPQRVSAHVLPKAPSFSSEDDEKTTIESGGWEEEASTTVEQGEVADKVRALGLEPARSNTAITSTDGGSMSDEPTVDDQRAHAALAMLPPPNVARLVVTRGSDTGRLLEVRPGKTYTIGRGIDNDLVLSDITASRKHFDLRHENGSWILVDRRSGNGTAVNDRIEDAPCMLASGDTIEVGNTVFRFDLITTAVSLPGLPRELPARGTPATGNNREGSATGVPELPRDAPDSSNMPTPSDLPPPRDLGAQDAHGGGAPRDGFGPRDLAGNAAGREVSSLVPTFDGSVDDDLELSTVSGKPLPDQEVIPTPVVSQSRPKTLPPPAPLPRPRTQTGRPPPGYALDRAGPRSQSMAVPAPSSPSIPPIALAAAMAPQMTPPMPAMAPTISPMHGAPMMAPMHGAPMMAPAGSPGIAQALSPAMAPTISPMHGAPLLPQPSTTLPLPQMANRPPLSPALLEPQLGALPTTLPGQGPPMPARVARLPFSYGPQDVPPHAPNGTRPPPNGHPRDATSTALVPPMSYSGNQPAMAPPEREGLPALSRRAKLALGGLGIAVFAAIAAIAIVRGVSRHGADNPAAGPTTTDPGDSPTTPPSPVTREPAPTTRTITPIDPATGTATGTATGQATGQANGTGSNATRNPAPAPPPGAGPGSAPRPQVASPTAPPASPTAPPAPPAPAPTPPTVPPAPPTGAPTPPAVAAAPPTAAPTPPTAAHPTPPTAPPTAPPVVASNTSPRDPSPSPAQTETSVGPTRPDRNTHTDRTDRNGKTGKHNETHRIAKTEPVAPPGGTRTEKKRTGKSTVEIRTEANALYKAKNFNGAAAALTSSLSGYSPDDVKELKTLAGIYTLLGKAYNVGMAPGTKPTEAYKALTSALGYDREVGSAYVPEIQRKLADVAVRASSYFMAEHQYALAFQAVRTAEGFGSEAKNNASVRSALQGIASDLLREGQRELSTDPDGAKQKLRTILGIVEPKDPLYIRAQKLLNGP